MEQRRLGFYPQGAKVQVVAELVKMPRGIETKQEPWVVALIDLLVKPRLLLNWPDLV